MGNCCANEHVKTHSYSVCESQRYIVMSVDITYMNKVHFEKSFLFELYPDFRLCEILLASFVTALLASSERRVVELLLDLLR